MCRKCFSDMLSRYSKRVHRYKSTVLARKTTALAVCSNTLNNRCLRVPDKRHLVVLQKQLSDTKVKVAGCCCSTATEGRL